MIPKYEVIDYESPTTDASSRKWARAFVFSGAIALACIPANFLFERMGWPDDFANIVCFVACVVCAICALTYLSYSKKREEAPLRHFALFTLAVLGGLLLLCVLAGIWFSNAMRDF